MSESRSPYYINAAHFDMRLKAAGTDAKPMLSAVASSDRVDLSGDKFSRDALAEMARAFPKKPVVFDHSYKLGNADLFGKVIAARLVERGAFLDLDVDIEPSMSNPKVAQLYSQLKDDNMAEAVGVSVGCMVNDATYETDPKTKQRVLIIKSATIMELSICTIPAQPRSVITAIKSSAVDLFTRQFAAAPIDDADASELAMAKLAIRALSGALRIKEAEIEERDQVVAGIMDQLNRIMDLPIGRKINDEAASLLWDIGDKYPWLDQGILATLARRRDA